MRKSVIPARTRRLGARAERGATAINSIHCAVQYDNVSATSRNLCSTMSTINNRKRLTSRPRPWPTQPGAWKSCRCPARSWRCLPIYRRGRTACLPGSAKRRPHRAADSAPGAHGPLRLRGGGPPRPRGIRHSTGSCARPLARSSMPA